MGFPSRTSSMRSTRSMRLLLVATLLLFSTTGAQRHAATTRQLAKEDEEEERRTPVPPIVLAYRGINNKEKSSSSSSQFPCLTGCPATGPAVCGDDGIRYLNACLAACQEVTATACHGREGGSATPIDQDVDTAATIDLKDMYRFATEGFKLVTKRAALSEGRPSDKYDHVASADDWQEVAGEASYVRMTVEGYEYVSTGESRRRRRRLTAEHGGEHEGEQVDEQAISYPATVPRNLVILGKDTREIVPNTMAFPYSTVLEMDYGSAGEGGCTATVISTQAALTAAHCVYEDGRFFNVRQASPGRYRSSGITIEPFGSWQISYMTTFNEWKDFESRQYDIAVIVFSPNSNGQYPFDVVGKVGLGQPSPNLSNLASARVIGYPTDKPNGQMWSSGTCSPSQWGVGGEYFGFHYCDTRAGNSGSAILTYPDYTAYGVHGYGFENFNGATLTTGSHFSAVREWALLDGTAPPPPAPSPTGSPPATSASPPTSAPPPTSANLSPVVSPSPVVDYSCPCETISNGIIRFGCSLLCFYACIF